MAACSKSAACVPREAAVAHFLPSDSAAQSAPSVLPTASPHSSPPENALCESSFPWRPRPSKRMSFVSSSCPPLSRRSAFAYDSIHGDLFRASLALECGASVRTEHPLDGPAAERLQARARLGPAADQPVAQPVIQLKRRGNRRR